MWEQSRRRSGEMVPNRTVTSFHDRQSRARRLAATMIAAFVLCFPAMLILESGLFAGLHHLATRADARLLALLIGWLMQLVPIHCAASVVIVAFMAGRRWIRFAGSGTSVAWMLGARWVSSPTDRLEERRLLNVAEEMALAAGVPTPSVFVLDGEPGINAFAAGTRRGLAAIIVTRGALEYLTRDELQGLVAHEMSHIVHGDMALNLRMLGLVAGLGALDEFARRASRIARLPWFVPVNSPSDIDGLLLMFLPIVVPVVILLAILDLCFVRILRMVGGLGLLAAQCLQASVNRTREELADASAVQYTRQARGIAGCLEKIGGLPRGSAVDHALAPLFSHMLFDSPAPSGRRPAFASHPPLAGRISKLDPAFDGRFDPPRPLAEVSDLLYRLGHAALNDPRHPEAIRRYRDRAEAMFALARGLKREYDATGDPRLRDELRRLEAERRDLWIDAGQAAARASASPLDHGALSNGIAPAKTHAPSAPVRVRPRLRDRLRKVFMSHFAWPVPEGYRPTVLTTVGTQFIIPWFLAGFLPWIVLMALSR